MIINFYGHTCFKLRITSGSLVTDPFDSKDITLPKTETDIVTLTENKNSNLNSRFKNKPFVINQPGEYEIKEISVFAYPAYAGSEDKQKNIFVFQMDELKICHLPAIDKDLTDDQLEELNEVDILLIGLGGKDPVKLVNKIEPFLVIPMDYQAGDSLLPDFVKELGQEPEKTDKINVTRASLPPELKLFILQ